MYVAAVFFRVSHASQYVAWLLRMLRMEDAQRCEGLWAIALFHIRGQSSNSTAEVLAHCASNPLLFWLAAHWPAGLRSKNIKYIVCGQVQTKLTRNICCCQVCLPAPPPFNVGGGLLGARSCKLWLCQFSNIASQH